MRDIPADAVVVTNDDQITVGVGNLRAAIEEMLLAFAAGTAMRPAVLHSAIFQSARVLERLGFDVQKPDRFRSQFIGRVGHERDHV